MNELAITYRPLSELKTNPCKLGDESTFDDHALVIELEEILQLDDATFEVVDTGFDIADVDRLVGALHDEPAEERVPPERGSVPALARPGDPWLIGKHRLFCGDSLDLASYAALLRGDLARVGFTDPPFNCPIDGHVSGMGKIKHREFVMASGEMNDGDFTQFLATALGHMRAFSTDGSIHYVFMDWRQIERLLEAGRFTFDELKNICVWNKGHGGMGSLYRSQHELIAVFKNGNAPHVNNVQLGRHGRNRTNVWSYPGMAGFQRDREKKLRAHSTVKPTALVADALLDCSNPGDLVLDPFAGSGTTILAAERCHRRCFAIELDPLYVDVALHRVREATGIEPVNAWTGTRLSRPSALPTLKSGEPK